MDDKTKKMMAIVTWIILSFVFLTGLINETDLEKEVKFIKVGIVILWVCMPWGSVFSSKATKGEMSNE